MRTIYYGKNYRVFLENGIGRTEVTTDLFDGMPDEIVDCYYYIPAGVTWRDSEGDEHTGECIVPSKDLAQFASMAKTVYAELDKPRTHFKIATIIVSAADILIDNKVPFASGTIGAILEVKFDDHWNGLDIHAVFEAGSVKRDVIVNGESVVIPSDILLKPGTYLNFGFCGYSKDTSEFVIRTSIYSLGFIPQGATIDGELPGDPGFSTVQDLIIKVGDLEKLETDAKTDLVSAVNELVNRFKSLGTLFRYKGKKPTISDFPDEGNEPGDVWMAVDTGLEHYWTEAGSWEYFGELMDLSEYAKKTDIPKVPKWAMTPNKPTYTAEEVGAQPKGAYVTPEMYGAKGDGISDDSEAIQDAINTGLDVRLSKTVYGIAKPLDLTDAGRLFGVFSRNGSSSVIKCLNDMPFAIYIGTAEKRGRHSVLKYVTINANATYNVSAKGLLLRCNDCAIDRVSFFDFSLDCFEMYDTWETDIGTIGFFECHGKDSACLHITDTIEPYGNISNVHIKSLQWESTAQQLIKCEPASNITELYIDEIEGEWSNIRQDEPLIEKNAFIDVYSAGYVEIGRIFCSYFGVTLTDKIRYKSLLRLNSIGNIIAIRNISILQLGTANVISFGHSTIVSNFSIDRIEYTAPYNNYNEKIFDGTCYGKLNIGYIAGCKSKYNELHPSGFFVPMDCILNGEQPQGNPLKTVGIPFHGSWIGMEIDKSEAIAFYGKASYTIAFYNSTNEATEVSLYIPGKGVDKCSVPSGVSSHVFDTSASLNYDGICRLTCQKTGIYLLGVA